DFGRDPGCDGFLVCARARRMEPHRRRSIALLQFFRGVAELAGVLRLWRCARVGWRGFPGNTYVRGVPIAGKDAGGALSCADSYLGLVAYLVRQPVRELSGHLPGERSPGRDAVETGRPVANADSAILRRAQTIRRRGAPGRGVKI